MPVGRLDLQVAGLASGVTAQAPHDRLRHWVRANQRLLTLGAMAIVALLAFAAIRVALDEIRLRDVRAALHQIGGVPISLSIALTAISYVALTWYDRFALQAIGHKLPWRISALASFTSYTLSHNLGLALITGGSARYRIYGASGLSLTEVARVSVITGLTFWGGVLMVVAIALVMPGAPIVIAGVAITPLDRGLGGGLLIATLAALPMLRLFGIRRLHIRSLSLPVPPIRLLGKQAAVALIDLLAASAALFVLMPDTAVSLYPTFFIAYTLAILIAMVTHVPGGIGVFEAVVLAVVPGDRGALFAALLLYRAIYYVLPLLVAATLLGAIEGRRLRQPFKAGISILEAAASSVAPALLALLVFSGGLVLLVSGALPAVHWRVDAVNGLLPLPFVEGSHFAASLVGTALLLIAPALNARLESGFHAARLMLLSGALFSLLKGFDYEEAMILVMIAGILQFSAPAFYRRSALLRAPLDYGWLIAAIAAIGLSLWAGFFAYKHVPYSDDLWWQFAIRGNAPRFLRASLGVGVALTAYGVWHLLSRSRPKPGLETLPPDVAERAIAATSRTDAMLAFTGDKTFLIAETHDAFLMYRVRGRTWVVMGDPVGPEERWRDLVWAIRDASDAARGRLCFYQVSERMLPVLIDLGLSTMKYGEEAHVSLADFTLDGPRAKSLRHSLRKAEAAELSFSIIPARDVPAAMPQLRKVSDAWLIDRPGPEKRFSVGRFDESYIGRFDCAVVWREGSIVAFANIWAAPACSELSVDLMRHLPDAPYGTMDYLFIQLMLWGKERGFARFNFGLAPLSGIHGGRLAPLWARLGATLFRSGERLYGFAGLRSFKDKYAPEWLPRYVAAPHGLGTPRALIDLVALVG
jgi:phosphatidylglycerol lysyltransferase